jgi:sulfur relay (sulfurtransferase) DsrF/TusC family protein
MVSAVQKNQTNVFVIQDGVVLIARSDCAQMLVQNTAIATTVLASVDKAGKVLLVKK